MNKEEWHIHFGLLDDEMSCLEAILKVFNGSIVAVRENPKRKPSYIHKK